MQLCENFLNNCAIDRKFALYFQEKEEIHQLNDTDNKAASGQGKNNVAETDEDIVSVRETSTFPEQEILSEDEIKPMTFLQFALFVFISLLLAVVSTFVWCHVTRSTACPSMNYIYVRLRYWYYFYFKTVSNPGDSYY